MSNVTASLGFAPQSTLLFSATVQLGTALGPIPLLDGGSRYVEPIIGGNISGPAFEATIEGGLAAPIAVTSPNGTSTKLAFIFAYGHASDGSAFYMEEAGIGQTLVQNTRIQMEVGGKYEALKGMFILAQPRLNADHSEAVVDCYTLSLPPQE